MTMSKLENALDYYDRGLCIIPVTPRDKFPACKWEQYFYNRPSRDEIIAWWTDNPEYNIGLITGKVSKIVVVDVEVEGVKNVDKILEDMPTRIISKSGSGGYHLFYSYPNTISKISNKVKILPNVDIRGDCGLIVLPPSTHPTGNEYSWIMSGKIGAFNPRWIQKAENDSFNPAINKKWITSILDGVGKGVRNDSATKLVGYYISKGLPEDVIYKLITDWNIKNEPPLPESDINIIIKSVTNTSKKNSVKSEASGEIFRLMEWNDYAVEYGDNRIKWAVEDWLPDNTIAFIVSPPGSFKTWLLLDLAVSISTGVPFLGQFPVLRQGPVILIQQEDFHGGIVERLSTIAYDRFMDGRVSIDAGSGFSTNMFPEKIPIFVHPDRNLKFDNKEVMDKLEDAISLIRPKLVIVDPLYTATSTDDFMMKSAEQMLRLKKLRDDYDCSFMIAHHTSKRKSDSKMREDLWGSQFLNAFLETGWQMRPDSEMSENIVNIRRHFKVKGNMETVQLTFDIQTDVDFKYSVRVGEVKQTQDQKALDLVTIIMESDKRLTQADLARMTNLNKSTISRHVKLLVEDGVLIKDGNYLSIGKMPKI